MTGVIQKIQVVIVQFQSFLFWEHALNFVSTLNWPNILKIRKYSRSNNVVSKFCEIWLSASSTRIGVSLKLKLVKHRGMGNSIQLSLEDVYFWWETINIFFIDVTYIIWQVIGKFMILRGSSNSLFRQVVKASCCWRDSLWIECLLMYVLA